jgi:hypothetical protein
VNGTAAVARYTLLELSRRKLLLIFFIIGAGGIALLGVVLKIVSTALGGNVLIVTSGTRSADPAKVRQVLELGFVSDLIGVLGIFALLIAFAIGMTAIYHDLESGAAVAIFSKPVSRLAYTAGKLAAAVTAMIVIVGVLSLEARVAMLLFGGGLEQALWLETLASVANATALMLLVLALSTWMNNIVAAVIAFVYSSVAGIVVSLHQAFDSGYLGNNAIIHACLTVLYWLVPHPLRSDALRQITRAQFQLFNPSNGRGPSVDQQLAALPGASGPTDVVWWLFSIVVFTTLVYVAVRRRQV